MDYLTTETRYGKMAFLPNDDPIGKSILDYGEWAQLEIEFLLNFIGPGCVVLDVGANIGTHSLAFSQSVGQHGAVIAFEPQIELGRMLEQNISSNQCANVEVRHNGVGSKFGEMFLPKIDYSTHLNTGAVALQASEGVSQHRSVQIVPLDSVHLERCDLVKIDVEGMESQVLSGMRGCIDQFCPVIFAECNSIESGVETFNVMRQLEYDTFLVRTLAYNDDNFRGAEHNVFGVAMEQNLLFVPSGDTVSPPELSERADVVSISSIDELAYEVLRTPCFGDDGFHDRDARWLKKELEITLARNCDLTSQSSLQLAQLASRETELKETETELKGNEEVLKTTLAEVAALELSWSWRITAPLRKVESMICGADRSVRQPSAAGD